MPGTRIDQLPSTAPPLPSPFSADGLEEAAMRGRLEARMFGTAPAPVRIGRYEVGDRIGAGGMGIVYSARDPELGRLVALKLFGGSRTGDPHRRERMLEEARTLARLSHPNVIQIYEIGEHDGSIFLALELIEGETLATWQRRAGRRWQEILAAYLDAVRGLAAAHAIGVVHRDVKPANILVGIDGRVRIADFGLAQATVEFPETVGPTTSSTLLATGAGSVAGTPAYMSPEQACGLEIDARSDLFSLCVSLFEGLYGVRPFDGVDRRELRSRGKIEIRALRAMIPRGASAPEWVLGIVARGLHPDPRRRFPDAAALLAAFEAAPRRLRRRRTAVGLVGVLALGGWGLTALPDAPPVCPALVDTLAGAWDPPRKEAIRRQFLATGLPFAAQAFRKVERTLDAAVIAWSRERQASCVKTRVEGSQSEEQFDLAADCLSEHEQALRDLAMRLANGETAVVTQAHALLREIGDPARCSSTDALRRGPVPPRTPEARHKIAEVRRALDEIKFLTTIADFDGAQRRLEDLSEDAAIHPSVHAEALLRRGALAARTGELDDAARQLHAALEEAEEVRDDRLAATILGELTELAIHGRRELPEARTYSGLCSAKLRRTEAGDAATADHLDRLGELEHLAGNFTTSLAHHEAAAGLRTPDDLLGRARNLKGTANALAELGRIDASIERLSAARDLFNRELGPSHPATAVVEYNLALSLRTRPDRTPDELAGAERLLRSALAIESRYGDGHALDAARTRLALAELLAERGELAQARATLEESLSVLEDRLPPTHDDLANALALAINIHIDGRAWGLAAEAASALIRLLRDRGEPIPFDLLHNAGEFHLRRGDPVTATPYFDQALALATLDDPVDPLHLSYALNGRGKVYLLQGDATQARALFERAVTIAATDAPMWLQAEIQWGMAQALARTGSQRSELRRFAEEALRLYRAGALDDVELTRIEAFLASMRRR